MSEVAAFGNDAKMKTIIDRAPGKDGEQRVLLVMLPGASDVPEGFVRYGFVQALRERRLAVDAIMVDAHMDYYFERSIASRLKRDVILPARAGQYGQIWLMGISLGGIGALLCARDQPAAIDGVILLAPYLASRGVIAEIVRRGGLDHWQPAETAPRNDEQAMLAWLKAYRSDDAVSPAIHLAYGTEDRFAAAGEMLARRLPAQHVVALQGGHDWNTWTQLWTHILDRGLFATGTTRERPRAQAANP